MVQHPIPATKQGMMRLSPAQHVELAAELMTGPWVQDGIMRMWAAVHAHLLMANAKAGAAGWRPDWDEKTHGTL